MIYLMLNDARGEICEFHGIFFSVYIEEIYFDPWPPFNLSWFARNWEASFCISTSILRMIDDIWIDHCNGSVCFIVVGLHKRDNNKSLIDSDLWCSESHASIVWIFDMFYHIFGSRSIFFNLILSNGSRDGSKYFIIFSCLDFEFWHRLCLKREI